MDMTIGIWGIALSFLAGFLMGRVGNGIGQDTPVGENGERIKNKEKKDQEGKDRAGMEQDEKLRPGEKKIPLGWAVGSPASGEVSYFYEGTRRGAMIVPDQGMLYAPASGKITRLYPTGNAMRLRTDYGVELLIQAGLRTGELEGRYYRPRVVQNEIVNKGKLLLEYDITGIRGEGYDASILMSVEEARDYQDITVCDAPRVKVGEDLMWIKA